MNAAEATGRATISELVAALKMAARPGAASLLLAVQRLIVSGITPDRELGNLGEALSRQVLKRIRP